MEYVSTVVAVALVLIVVLFVVALARVGFDKQRSDAAAREYHDRENRAARARDGA